MQFYQNAAKAVLLAATPEEKTSCAHDLRRLWITQSGTIAPQKIDIPIRPARPEAPECVSPGNVPRRRLGTVAGRAALLHAIAHIEFNAIDLAADMIARFAYPEYLGGKDVGEFIDDWSSVCDDEARHFGLVSSRLMTLETHYGALPAHDGLWQAAEATRHDILARLAVAPMVLEARGLDVTPGMIRKLRAQKDDVSADILQVIYDDEIGHVAKGKTWFSRLANADAGKAEAKFHFLVRKYYNGLLKPPFNAQARDLAGMPRSYYEPLAYSP